MSAWFFVILFVFAGVRADVDGHPFVGRFETSPPPMTAKRMFFRPNEVVNMKTVFYKIQITKQTRQVSLSMPIDGKINSGFGYRTKPKKKFHNGIDISGRFGQVFSSAGDGKVVLVGRERGYGKVIVVEHGNGIRTKYAHCDKTMVSVGDYVKAGQRIGTIGRSGVITGIHLHFEMLKNGKPVDPLKLL